MAESLLGTAFYKTVLSVREYAAGIWQGVSQAGSAKQEQPMTNCLTEVDLMVLSGRLQDVLDRELLYLNPELTPECLAAHAQMTVCQLAEVLMRGICKPFDRLLAEYRIEAMKVLLKNPKMAEMNLFLLAHECGFASRKAFKKAFVEYTGQTLEAYKESLAGSGKALIL
ncbi:helix-turn-helix domain-containing protein [Arsenicibacter rosenii]|uniref:HTH araC/xylS-type domain-containing protein n=1 Tax=Arsenicibacter rosenii TaxID=1750698 RepID=A0A1S2VIH8_9BACT|nr:AraC family transcriptional regulator [Arsenicibacter rosenii]OIN58561.1 hypothetical protein BLX24_13380 [Arsenicibacter rosenii]